MRRIAFLGSIGVLIALTTVALHGGDVVDATCPANASDIERLLQRIEELESRVLELESRAVGQTAPAPITFVPHNHDGVLRADQVKIYSHFQRVIPEVQTAGKVRSPAHQRAEFRSGGVNIIR